MTEAQEKKLLATVAGITATLNRQAAAINEQASAIEQLGALHGYEFTGGAWKKIDAPRKAGING